MNFLLPGETRDFLIEYLRNSIERQEEDASYMGQMPNRDSVPRQQLRVLEGLERVE